MPHDEAGFNARRRMANEEALVHPFVATDQLWSEHDSAFAYCDATAGRARWWWGTVPEREGLQTVDRSKVAI